MSPVDQNAVADLAAELERRLASISERLERLDPEAPPAAPNPLTATSPSDLNGISREQWRAMPPEQRRAVANEILRVPTWARGPEPPATRPAPALAQELGALIAAAGVSADAWRTMPAADRRALVDRVLGRNRDPLAPRRSR